MQSKQKGMISLSLLLIIVGALILFWQAVRLAPAYLENYRVSSVLESLKTEQDLGKRSRLEVITLLLNRLDAINVNNVSQDDLIITRSFEKTIVSISYSAHIHFLANIDFVVSFEEQVEVVH